MKENKENIKVLSKEDVIKLSNYTKRQEFLSDYESWGVWLDIPELNIQVYKAELPNGKVIFVTCHKIFIVIADNIIQQSIVLVITAMSTMLMKIVGHLSQTVLRI